MSVGFCEAGIGTVMIATSALPVDTGTIRTGATVTAGSAVSAPRDPGVLDRGAVGWIHSETGDQKYHFPGGYFLPAGDYVKVHSGPGAISNPSHDLK